MTVGVREPSDGAFDRRATIYIERRKYENQRVYEDAEAPGRRDVFLPTGVDTGNLPPTATVKWMGDTYQASLDFRAGEGGQPIPVYTFYVET